MSARSLNMSINDVRDKDKYLTCLSRLSKVMDVVQTDEYSGKGKRQDKLRDKLLEEVHKVHLDVGLKIFTETLFRMMLVPFQCKDNNPYGVRIIEFFFTIICDERWGEGCSQQSPNETLNGSLIDDGATEFLPMKILRLCERYHPDTRQIVRLRIMQTVAKIIPDRLQINEIRKNFQIKLIKMLITRMKDKSEQVRAIGARNLCEFIADEVPFQPQIIDTLLDRMRHDPEHIVRTKIVSCIKITDDTLEHVVERTGDPNANVRAAAIKRVSDSIPLASLTIDMREVILRANITENAPTNVEKAIGGLLESWLKCLENDPCEFLRILNVRKRMSLCYQALNSLYNQPGQEAFEKMAHPLLNDKRYPEESLCIESTYLWLYMYRRFKDDPYVYNKLALPVNEMIDYIIEYVEVVDDEGDLPVGDLEYRSWMLGDLLQILSFLPVEEGERKAILEFVPTLCLKKKLMDERNSALAVKLISVCSNLDDETNVIDLVNCLLDSDRPSVRKSTSRTSSNIHTASASEVLHSSETDDSESPTSMKIELGNLMHRTKKLERDRDIAVKENDMYKAQSCQDEINDLEGQIQKVKEAILAHANPTVVDANETMEEEEEQWTYSNKTMLIVLSIIKRNILLRDKISDFSRTFYEMYVVKAVSKSRDHAVRTLALELMCIVALDFEEENARTTLYCLMALLKDSINVKVTALKCLYDLVLRYSFTKLGAFPEVQGVLMGSNVIKEVAKGQVNVDDPASTLKSLLLSYIRHEDVRLVKVSVTGVLKLLFKKEMNSSRLITTFLINWAIPSQDAQIRFKDVGTMIPVYASIGETETIEVAQCLINCIKKTLMKMHSRAQGDELVPHPDIEKIIGLIVKCTDPSRLTEFQRCYVGHEIIATEALKELRNTDLITEEKMQYAKLLKVLDLRQCPPVSINQMIHTLSDIVETSNKTVGQILRGFSSYLESLIEDVEDTVVEEEKGNLNTNDGDADETVTSHVPAGAFDNDSE